MKLDQWINELETHSTKHDIVTMLVGNKIDKVAVTFLQHQVPTCHVELCVGTGMIKYSEISTGKPQQLVSELNNNNNNNNNTKFVKHRVSVALELITAVTVGMGTVHAVLPHE